jgi:hypothetical protein
MSIKTHDAEPYSRADLREKAAQAAHFHYKGFPKLRKRRIGFF